VNKEVRKIFDVYWNIIKVTYPNKTMVKDGVELFSTEYAEWLRLTRTTLLDMVNDIELKLLEVPNSSQG
jgi:hypothetical protein